MCDRVKKDKKLKNKKKQNSKTQQNTKQKQNNPVNNLHRKFPDPEDTDLQSLLLFAPIPENAVALGKSEMWSAL